MGRASLVEKLKMCVLFNFFRSDKKPAHSEDELIDNAVFNALQQHVDKNSAEAKFDRTVQDALVATHSLRQKSPDQAPLGRGSRQARA
jgi:hypothetical protein